MTDQEVLDILKDYKNKSNKNLTDVMDFLQDDFQKTKDLIVKLTYHLDETEKSYNKVYDEFKKRING
jgi:DNA anti-recombination protein RmuC